MKDYYSILEITPTASVEVIKAAYRALAKKYHPDTTNDSTYSEKMMKEVNEAYSVLSDPISRARYDAEYKREYNRRERENTSYEKRSSSFEQKKSDMNAGDNPHKEDPDINLTHNTQKSACNETPESCSSKRKEKNSLLVFMNFIMLCIGVIVFIVVISGISNAPINKIGMKQASHVEWLSERKIWHQDEEERFVFVFSLLDGNKRELYVPAKVQISIVNESGEEVYKRTRSIVEEDYLEWTYHNDGSVKRQATIYINDSDIKQGNIGKGTLFFTAYDEGGQFDFGELELPVIAGLPLKPIVVKADLPCTISSHDYTGNVSTKIQIKEVKYEMKYGNTLYMYLSGEKLYDHQGSQADNVCEFTWRLYDSQGYLIESGTHNVWNLMVGDEFKGECLYVFDGIVPGEVYNLKFGE